MRCVAGAARPREAISQINIQAHVELRKYYSCNARIYPMMIASLAGSHRDGRQRPRDTISPFAARGCAHSRLDVGSGALT
jgi:hypothetical protein